MKCFRFQEKIGLLLANCRYHQGIINIIWILKSKMAFQTEACHYKSRKYINLYKDMFIL